MRSIEDVFSVVGPDSCGSEAFVDKKFNPVCPVSHVLHYQGEKLDKFFKRRTGGQVKKIAFTLGVLPAALQEFIVAWDHLNKDGKSKKEAFDLALSAAEAVEIGEENRQKALASLREKANHRLYENVLKNTKFLKPSIEHTSSFSLELADEGWRFEEIFERGL